MLAGERKKHSSTDPLESRQRCRLHSHRYRIMALYHIHGLYGSPEVLNVLEL